MAPSSASSVAGGWVDDDAGAAQHVAVFKQGIAQAAQAMGKEGLRFVQLGRLQHAVLPEGDGIDVLCRVETVVNGGCRHGFNQKGRQKGSTYSWTWRTAALRVNLGRRSSV